MCVGMGGVYLLADPPLDHREHMRPLLGGEFMPFANLVNLLEATAATSAGAVLGNEDRMIAPRRLLPIIPRKRRCQPLRNELRSMLHDGGQSPRLDVRALASDEPELAPERGGGQPSKGFIDVDHEGGKRAEGTGNSHGVRRSAAAPYENRTLVGRVGNYDSRAINSAHAPEGSVITYVSPSIVIS